MELLGQLEQYRPFNEQEERDRDILLRCLREEGDIFTRDNAMAHMTASAWVVTKNKLLNFNPVFRTPSETHLTLLGIRL